MLEGSVESSGGGRRNAREPWHWLLHAWRRPPLIPLFFLGLIFMLYMCVSPIDDEYGGVILVTMLGMENRKFPSIYSCVCVIQSSNVWYLDPIAIGHLQSLSRPALSSHKLDGSNDVNIHKLCKDLEAIPPYLVGLSKAAYFVNNDLYAEGASELLIVRLSMCIKATDMRF